MDTMRLRAIQQPSRVEALLESFAVSGCLIPPDAQPPLDFDRLPREFPHLIRRSGDEVHAWRAWSDDRQVWFLLGERSLPLSRERGRPVLCISQYDEEASIPEAPTWLRSRADRGDRRRV
jgi:hypothetical protein